MKSLQSLYSNAITFVRAVASHELPRSMVRLFFRVIPRVIPRILGQLSGRELWVWREMRCPTAFCGSPWKGHAVNVEELDETSVVYSFGVGSDVSFELDLIRKTGCEVHAFDPSLEVEAKLRDRPLPGQFHFHPWGLSDHDGKDRFRFRPQSWMKRLLRRDRRVGPTNPGYEAEAYSLETIQQKLGHHHLDLVKIDIGGGEYRVLRDFFHTGTPFDQLVVEFHHRRAEADALETREVLNGLWADGFRVFSIDAGGREFGLKRAA